MTDIIISYEKLKEALLAGIKDYLDFIQGNKNVNDKLGRYGTYHGKKGIKRAENARKYINKFISENENKNEKIKLLMVMFAIFQPMAKALLPLFTDWVPGRSSALASFIADRMITEDCENRNHLNSEVFSREQLSLAANAKGNIFSIGEDFIPTPYFHKTEGVKWLLKKVNDELSEEEKRELNQFSKDFKSIIEKHENFDFKKFGLLFVPSADSQKNKSDILSTQNILKYK